MSYTVTLCDSTFSDVTNTSIVLEAHDTSGTVIDTKKNAPVGTEWGATLSFSPARRRFEIEICTRSTPYAPLVLVDLNGDRTPQTIDVILLSASASHSERIGPAPSSSGEIQAYVRRQGWSQEKRDAIYTTIRTLLHLKRFPGSTNRPIRLGAEELLRDVGIGPDLIIDPFA